MKAMRLLTLSPRRLALGSTLATAVAAVAAAVGPTMTDGSVVGALMTDDSVVGALMTAGSVVGVSKQPNSLVSLSTFS